MCSHNFFQTLSTFVDFHLLGVEGRIPDQEVQSLQLNFSGKRCRSMKFEISTDINHTEVLRIYYVESFNDTRFFCPIAEHCSTPLPKLF